MSLVAQTQWPQLGRSAPPHRCEPGIAETGNDVHQIVTGVAGGPRSAAKLTCGSNSPRGRITSGICPTVPQCRMSLLALIGLADLPTTCPLLGEQLPRGSMLAEAVHD
jgi:hypothetical protein